MRKTASESRQGTTALRAAYKKSAPIFLSASVKLRSHTIAITGIHWPLNVCENECLSSIVGIKSFTSCSRRHALGLGDHLLIALFIINAGLALLYLDRLLDILGSGLRIHNTKDDINFLERKLLGFWNKDPDKDRHRQAEDREHQERLPSNAVDGRRCDFCDDEVKEPLGCSYEDG
jgi:hypothetical protein